MAKKVTNTAATAASTTSSTATAPKATKNVLFMFEKQNYMLMVAGLLVIILGFLLMLGTNNTNPSAAAFESDIYSFRRITLAPICLLYTSRCV